MSRSFGSRTFSALAIAAAGMIACTTQCLEAQTLFDQIHGDSQDAVYGELSVPARLSQPTPQVSGAPLNLQEFGHSPSFEEIFGSDNLSASAQAIPSPNSQSTLKSQFATGQTHPSGHQQFGSASYVEPRMEASFHNHQQNVYVQPNDGRFSRLSIRPHGHFLQQFFGHGGQDTYQDNSPMKLGFQSDVLYFQRGGADDTFFVFDEDTLQPLLRHSDLQFDDETATRYRLNFQSQGGTGFEFQYFNFEDFAVTRRMSGVIPVFFGGQPSNLSASYDLTYDTELKNHEFNAWVRSNQHMRIGIGGRYVDLREEFNVTEGTNSSFFSTEGFFTDADNDLFGSQFLADFYVPLAPGLTLELGGRAGVYHNNMDIRVRTATRDIHYEDEALSTVFDLNAGVSIQVTPMLKVNLGYQAMFLNDVALGPSQSTDYDFFATTAEAQLSDLTVDGGYFGIELQF